VYGLVQVRKRKFK